METPELLLQTFNWLVLVTSVTTGYLLLNYVIDPGLFVVFRASKFRQLFIALLITFSFALTRLAFQVRKTPNKRAAFIEKRRPQRRITGIITFGSTVLSLVTLFVYVTRESDFTLSAALIWLSITSGIVAFYCVRLFRPEFAPAVSISMAAPGSVLGRLLTRWRRVNADLSRFGAKVNALPFERKIRWVLLISGLLGLGLGVMAVTMQVAVDQGQVLSGLVRYPSDNPTYIYNAKLWNVWGQLSALGLRLGLSEFVNSLLLSALSGLLIVWGFSLWILAITQYVFMPVVRPFFSVN